MYNESVLQTYDCLINFYIILYFIFIKNKQKLLEILYHQLQQQMLLFLV